VGGVGGGGGSSEMREQSHTRDPHP
jgi:hypothetical protein